jgi:hypothetical protein
MVPEKNLPRLIRHTGTDRALRLSRVVTSAVENEYPSFHNDRAVYPAAAGVHRVVFLARAHRRLEECRSIKRRTVAASIGPNGSGRANFLRADRPLARHHRDPQLDRCQGSGRSQIQSLRLHRLGRTDLG